MFFTVLNSIFTTFGPAIFVPVILFFIALILRVTLKKAFSSALLAGIGLTGFTMLINVYVPMVAPVVQSMVKTTGVHLPVMDIGWQAASIVGYSTQVGMIFIGLALLVQMILFFVRWTNIFMPGDLWNNYSFMVWGSMLYLITKNMLLAMTCMIVMNLYVLLFAEVLEKRWSNHYGYPNCALTAPHHVEAVPYAIAMNWVLNKLGLNKIKWEPEALQDRLGFLGEPMFLGFILGLLIGVLGNLNDLGTLKAWGTIVSLGMSTGVVMAVFPKVAGIFASAFTVLTEAGRNTAKSGAKNREWFLAINDAAGYGEPATLTTGIILIPIMVLIAVILPGNKTLPLVDLIALPFMVEVIISVSHGNILKGIISGAIWFSLGLYMCTYTAPMFTQVAASVGVKIPVAGVMVTSFGILAHPIMGLLFLAFLSKNPVIIAGVVVIYFILYFMFKKNKQRIHEYLEKANDLPDEVGKGVVS